MPIRIADFHAGGLASRVGAMSGLINYPAQIWLAAATVDMRRGLDGFSAIVQQSLGRAPCAGSAFKFRNRAGNRLRLLLWDGIGWWRVSIGSVYPLSRTQNGRFDMTRYEAISVAPRHFKG